MSKSSDGRDGRDDGIALVASHNANFMANGIGAVMRLHREHKALTGEQIRLRLSEEGITPRHSNAWGALINYAQRMGLISFCGRYEQMADPRSHARKTPVYYINAKPRSADETRPKHKRKGFI